MPIYAAHLLRVPLKNDEALVRPVVPDSYHIIIAYGCYNTVEGWMELGAPHPARVGEEDVILSCWIIKRVNNHLLVATRADKEVVIGWVAGDALHGVGVPTAALESVLLHGTLQRRHGCSQCGKVLSPSLPARKKKKRWEGQEISYIYLTLCVCGGNRSLAAATFHVRQVERKGTFKNNADREECTAREFRASWT